jgi:hypothetical protein
VETAIQRSKLLVALAGLAVVSGAGAVVLWPTQPNRITQENCDRIKEGMIRAEVETILGPPGDYSTGPTHWPSWLATKAFGREIGEGSYTLLWETDTASLFLTFNADNRVAGMSQRLNAREKQSALENLVWRAKRQWHRWFP